METSPRDPSFAPPPPPISATGSSFKTSGFAITSLVLGIVSLIGGVFILIPPLLATIFGHIAVSQCNRNPALTGKGLGIAGLVMGYVSGVVLLPLMAAMAIPAYQKVREASQDKAIINNVRQLAQAADTYYLENGKTTVAFSELVGSGKYMQPISPVAGERYPQTFKLGEPLVVTKNNGKEIRYDP